MNVEERKQIETKIIRELCQRAIANCWYISYNDGEDWPVKRSQDIDAIMAEVHSTDEALIVVRDKDQKRLGSVTLIYGEDGYDVLADYSWRQTPRDQDGPFVPFMESVYAWIEEIQAKEAAQ